MVYTAVVSFIVYHLFRLYPPQTSGILSVVTQIIIGFLMVPFDAVLLAVFGTTVGKFFAGIRVTYDSGRKLKMSEAFVRNLSRFIYGQGCCIPFYSIYKNWKCYRACSNEEIMGWDMDVTYQIKEAKPYRDFAFLAAGIMTVCLGMAVQISAYFPKYKDDGTVQTYVKNYNAVLENIYGIENVCLDEDGYLRERESEYGGYTIDLFSPETEQGEPVILVEFSEKNGKLSQITMKRQYEFIGFVPTSFAYNEAALYTVIASQKEFGVLDYLKLSSFFNEYEQNILSETYEDTFQNVSYEQTVLQEGEGCQMNLQIKMK